MNSLFLCIGRMKIISGTSWALDKVEEEQEIQSEVVEQQILNKVEEEQEIQSEVVEQILNANPMVMPRFLSNALYITDLDPAFVTEGLLFDLFSQVGTVLSVRLCTNSKSCHAYVNFNTVEEGMSKRDTS